MTRVLVDKVAPIVTSEPARPSADVAIDRDRLREELSRRTADLQALESRMLSHRLAWLVGKGSRGS